MRRNKAIGRTTRLRRSDAFSLTLAGRRAPSELRVPGLRLVCGASHPHRGNGFVCPRLQRPQGEWRQLRRRNPALPQCLGPSPGSGKSEPSAS